MNSTGQRMNTSRAKYATRIGTDSGSFDLCQSPWLMKAFKVKMTRVCTILVCILLIGSTSVHTVMLSVMHTISPAFYIVR